MNGPKPTRVELEAITSILAGSIRERLGKLFGKQVGFCLLLFDFGDVGDLAYASNAERAGMLDALKEAIEVLEGRRPS